MSMLSTMSMSLMSMLSISPWYIGKEIVRWSWGWRKKTPEGHWTGILSQKFFLLGLFCIVLAVFEQDQGKRQRGKQKKIASSETTQPKVITLITLEKFVTMSFLLDGEEKIWKGSHFISNPGKSSNGKYFFIILGGKSEAVHVFCVCVFDPCTCWQ